MDLVYRKIVEAAKVPIIIGIVVQLLLLIAFAALTQITDKAASDLITLAIVAFSFIFYLVLFIWSGYRAVKQFGYDIISAGVVGAAAYLGIGIITSLLIIIFFIVFVIANLLVFGRAGNAGGGSSSTIADLTGGAFGIGLLILVALACILIYLFELAIGACINFAVGCAGGWLASRK